MFGYCTLASDHLYMDINGIVESGPPSAILFFTDVGELVEHRIHNRLIRYMQLFMGGKFGPWRRVTKVHLVEVWILGPL